MLCASIVDVEAALQAGHYKLVHVDVCSIILQPAHAILHIALSPANQLVICKKPD